MLDSANNRRIELAEFEKVLPALEEFGIKVTNAAATFKSIDKKDK
jgi:hypothetical protein